MIEEACKVFKVDQYHLTHAASDPKLICSPDDLINLLGKMKNQRHQVKAIEDGVWHLFGNKRTECLDPLLNALEGNESFKYLKGIAIKRAFREGYDRGNKPIVERLYDNSAVTSDDYAQGLIHSGIRSTQDPTFIFLIGEADQGDLNAVKKQWLYEDRSNDFKKALEDALLTAMPGGDRLNRVQRTKHTMKMIEKDSSMNMPKVISQLIGYYLVDESILKSRIRLDELVMDIFKSDSSMGIPTVVSELIVSYLVEKSTLESITTPVKQAISIKGTQQDDSADESA